MSMREKQLILDHVQDLVGAFTYYDRKEGSLTQKDLDQAIKTGIISTDEIVEKFKQELEKVYPK